PAGNAEEAFALIARTRFDLVMSDLRLPGLRGWGFAARLRSIDPVLPLIMLTGSAPDDDDLCRVRGAGIAVLRKPVPLPQLETALTAALGGRAARCCRRPSSASAKSTARTPGVSRASASARSGAPSIAAAA